MNSIPRSQSHIFFTIYFSKRFLVLHFTFKPMAHFDLIFVKVQAYLMKRLSYFIELPLHSCQNQLSILVWVDGWS